MSMDSGSDTEVWPSLYSLVLTKLNHSLPRIKKLNAKLNAKVITFLELKKKNSKKIFKSLD